MIEAACCAVGALRAGVRVWQRRWEAARECGGLSGHADLELIADQAYGLLWYRVLLGEAELSAEVGRELAHALIKQHRG